MSNETERQDEVIDVEIDPFEMPLEDDAPTTESENANPEDASSSESAANAAGADGSDLDDTSAGDDDLIPEKFRNKSRSEIAKSYAELESRFGQRNNEHGQLRSLVDRLLQQGTQPGTGATSDESDTEIDADDLLERPAETVTRLLQKDPTIRKLNDRMEAAAQKEAQTELNRRHSDVQELFEDSHFQEWLQGSPVRTRLLKEAHENYDVDAADELLTTYKTTQQLLNRASAEDRGNKASKTARSTGGVEGKPGGVETTQKERPVFNQSKLIELKMKDPARYSALQSHIMAAYREGRVIHDI